MRIAWLVLLLCLGCDSGGGSTLVPGPLTDATVGDAATDAGASNTPLQAAVIGTYVLPEFSVRATTTAAGVLVNALFVASAQGGGGQRLVTTGTVAQQGEMWTWSAEPADALVVRIAEETLRFTVATAEAADLSSPEAVLAGDHRLVFAVTGAQGSLDVSSVKQGQARDLRIDGTLTREGVDYTLDGLRYQGTERAESDSSGAEYFNAYTLSGEIRWAEARLTLAEQWRFEIVVADRGSAQSAERVNDNVLERGGDRYEWLQATTRKAFRDGKPSDESYWTAMGEVRRNGEAYGQYRLAVQRFTPMNGLIRFLLVLPDQTIELERVQNW